MKRYQTWFLAGCFAIGPTVGGLFAADVAKDEKAPARDVDLLNERKATSTMLLRAKDLIGKSVKNEEGKDIGTIQEIVVDSNRGRVAYAVLQFGGFLGFGEKQFAIPFQALQEDAARQNLILNIQKEKLEAARGFEKDKWPNMADEAWARDVHKHYGYDNYWENRDRRLNKTKTDEQKRDQPIATEPKQDPQPNSLDPKQSPQLTAEAERRRELSAPQLNREHFWVNRVTQMFGKPVKNKADENLGRIADFMIDMKHSRLVYAVLTDGGTLGIGEMLTAVPSSAIKADPEKEQFTLDSTKDAIKAHSFKEGAWPNMSDMHWARGVHEGFKQEPYWTVFGYAGDDVDPSWRDGSDYNKMFNAQKTRTITGKVTTLSDFSPARDSAKGRMVVVTNEAGEAFTVHLGPVSYLDRKDGALVLKEGETITVVGSTGTFDGKETIQAYEVRPATGQAYPLRNSQGHARWNRENDRPATSRSSENISPIAESKPESKPPTNRP